MRNINKLLPYILITLAAIALMFLFMYIQKPDAVTTTVLVSSISAFLGVALTMGVTQMQLDNQTKTEEQKKEKEDLKNEIESLKKEQEDRITAAKRQQKLESEKELTKESIIFEQRLKIYQDYLKTLLTVIEDGELSDAEKLKLQFQTSFIAMHTSSEHIKRISESVQKIIVSTCRNNELMILEPLFDLVYVFRDELYNGKDNDASEYTKQLALTIENFQAAYDLDLQKSDSPQYDSRALESVGPARSPGIESGSLWDKKVAEWAASGWEMGISNQRDWFELKRSNHTIPGKIAAGFRLDQAFIHTEILPEDIDFANFLKWNLPPGVDESHRRWGRWETSGNDLLRSLKPCDIITAFQQNATLAEFVCGVIDYLICRQNESYRLSMIRKYIADNSKLDIETWSAFKLRNFKTLFTEHAPNSGTEGAVSVEIYENYEANKIQLFMRNTWDAKTSGICMRKLGIADRDLNPESDNGQILLEQFDFSTDLHSIAHAMLQWMDKIRMTDNKLTPKAGVD